MSDPDTPRPELPDPQHDEHVAFPDDVLSGDDREATLPVATGVTLPPEAWAPRPEPAASPPPSTSSWQPDVRPGSILTTPPRRPSESPRRTTTGTSGAKVLAGIVLVPLLIAFLSSGSQDPYVDAGTDGGTVLEAPVGGDMPAGVDPMMADPVTVELAADTSGVLPAIPGKPGTVAVPDRATALRVEVVSLPTADAAAPPEVLVQTFANDFATDTSSMPLPFAATVQLNERPSSLEVTATVVSGTGKLQCRVYDGSRLVAISTGGATVTCSPQM